MTRRGASGRTTIADADVNLVEGGARMPHLEYANDRAAMDVEFPSLSVPSDVGDNHEDFWDTWDKVLLRGQEIAEEVGRRMAQQGRRRYEEVDNKEVPEKPNVKVAADTSCATVAKPTCPGGSTTGGALQDDVWTTTCRTVRQSFCASPLHSVDNTLAVPRKVQFSNGS